MGNVIIILLTTLIAFFSFKLASKNGVKKYFLSLTVLGLIVGYFVWVDYYPLSHLPMFLAVGLILGYMPLSILLYFKLVKTNRSRVFYAFVISLVFLFTKKVFISLTDKGIKTPDNVKIIDLILSILTIASILFLLTIIVLSIIKWINNLHYKRTFEDMYARAKSGDALAQNNLGVMYNEGLGVNQDINEAMIWFNKAAEQKLPAAEINLQALLEEHPELRKD